LLLEWLAGLSAPSAHVVNVASGEAVSIRAIIEEMCGLAGVATKIEIDDVLSVSTDPAENPRRAIF